MPQTLESDIAPAQELLEKEQTPDKPRKGWRGYAQDDEIVAARHLNKVVGFSSTTAWRLRNKNLFPAPIRLSPGRVGWRKVDLLAWLDARQKAAGR